jgi:DNA-binding response OmpR family regulator
VRGGRGRGTLLWSREAGLLATMAREPGRVFHRQSLLDAGWGENVLEDERTVDVHVFCLRGKVAASRVCGAAIHTVHGAG